MYLYSLMLGLEVDWTLGAKTLRHVSNADSSWALDLEELSAILTLERHRGLGRKNQPRFRS